MTKTFYICEGKIGTDGICEKCYQQSGSSSGYCNKQIPIEYAQQLAPSSFEFVKWVGENGYSKHQVNDRWYDKGDEFIGNTSDLYKLFIEQPAERAAQTDVAADDDWVEIKVGNELPDYDEFVLWLREDGIMFIDEIDHDNDWHHFKLTHETDFAEQTVKLTHWRPLPKPPKQ